MIKGGDVAQLGEHLVRNEGVVGSNPIISTTYTRYRAGSSEGPAGDVLELSEIVLGGEVAVPCTRNPL
jgi:hypothetical protein